MGIINVTIVIPMILQNVTFGFILKHFPGNDPGKAISFAGTFFLPATLATTLIQTTKVNEDTDVPPDVISITTEHPYTYS